MNEQREIGLKFTNKVTGEAKLERYAKQLNVIKSAMSGINTGMIRDIEQSAGNIKEISEDTDTMSKKVNAAFNYTALRTFSRGLKTVTTTMSSLVTQSSSFLEDFNLFQVAFNGNYRSAERFVNKLSEMYGLDEGWLTRTTGIFKQLANAMDLSVESGEKLSELMTQMSIDISSLYNVDVERASSVLQSALAGQTKPIRSLTGGDITQATLQTTLDNLGIDRAISQLSFAEKRLVIMISLTQQLSESAGDWGRTLESPANQTRILNEQWTRLSRAVGNLFLPIVSKILPYLNAILMVLTEIINTIASFFGFKIEDYDYFGSMAGSAWDFDDAVSSAGSSVDKLKDKMKGLRGFDKLNVINSPSPTSGGGTGGAGSGGIDPAVMGAFNKAFEDYQNKIKDVQMKATKIRDAIMDWLGFTKEIDSETGKVSFKLKDGLQRIHLIAAAIGLLTGIKIINGIKGLITGTSRLGRLLGTGGLYKTLTKLIEPIKVLGAKDGLKYIFLDAKSSIAKFLPVATKVTVVIGGIVSAIMGANGLYKSFKKMTKESEYGGKEYKNYLKSLLALEAGAIAVGAVLGGGLGAAIGGIAGVVIAATAVWKGYDDAMTDIAKNELFGTINISMEEWNKILKNSTINIENFGSKLEKLRGNLENYNSSFESSASSLDLYGYKFGVLGQKISEEDAPKILGAITDMGEQSTKIIEESTNYSLEIWGSTFAQMSTLTDEEEGNILNSILNYGNQQKSEIANAQKNITSTYENAINTRGYLTDEEYKYISEQLNKIRQLTETEMTKNQANIEYYKSVFAEKNQKLDEESYKNFSKALQGYKKEQLDIIEENYKTQLQEAKYYYDQGAISEEQYQGMLKTANKKRKDDTKTLRKDLNDIQKNVYKDLAERYKEIETATDKTSKKQKKIIEGIFKDINIDSSDIVRKFGSVGDEAGKMCAKNIAKGINSGNLKFSIDSKNVKGTAGELPLSVTARWNYAQGGLPPVGQIFVANERGPELVGNIGGQSFVANQNQMMDLLDRKIGNAQNNSKPQVFNIYLDSNHKIGTYTLEQLQDMAKTNGKPITIGY